MFPLRDVIQSRTTPWVTSAIIALNVLVFFYELSLGPDALSAFVFTHGLMPSQITSSAVVTSIFLHGGWLHLAGNMVSLWIFGDNVEDRMGHGRFLIFYLLAGVLANLAQVAALPDSAVPLIGASGAIAGVMGAYLVMFPSSRILVLIFLFVYIDMVEVPAVAFLVFWFLLQLVSGVGQVAGMSGDNIGFWAHVGGFVTGALAVWLFRRPERAQVEWWG